MGDALYKVHRCLLGVGERRSDFFKAQFERWGHGDGYGSSSGAPPSAASPNEHTDLTALLPAACLGEQNAVWETVLDYWYTGELQMSPYSVVRQFKIAHALQIPHLARRTVRWIELHLNDGVNTVLPMLHAALQLGPRLDAIEDACVRTLSRELAHCAPDALLGLPTRTVRAVLDGARTIHSGDPNRICAAVTHCLRALEQNSQESQRMFLGLASCLTSVRPEDALFLLAKVIACSDYLTRGDMKTNKNNRGGGDDNDDNDYDDGGESSGSDSDARSWRLVRAGNQARVAAVRALCLPVIAEHFSELKHQDLAHIDDHDVVCELLDRDDLDVGSEDGVFAAIQQYCQLRTSELFLPSTGGAGGGSGNSPKLEPSRTPPHIHRTMDCTSSLGKSLAAVDAAPSPSAPLPLATQTRRHPQKTKQEQQQRRLQRRRTPLSSKEVAAVWATCRFTSLSQERLAECIGMAELPAFWVKLGMMGRIIFASEGQAAYNEWASSYVRNIDTKTGVAAKAAMDAGGTDNLIKLMMKRLAPRVSSFDSAIVKNTQMKNLLATWCHRKKAQSDDEGASTGLGGGLRGKHGGGAAGTSASRGRGGRGMHGLSGRSTKPEMKRQNSRQHELRNPMLLYRGSRDGFGGANFHSRCDGKANTLTLIRCTEGNVFGGYLGSSWSNHGGLVGTSTSEKTNIPCPRAFLFSLIRVEDPNGQPARFMVNTQQEFAGGAWSDCGPTFGINKAMGSCDLFIADKCNTRTRIWDLAARTA